MTYEEALELQRRRAAEGDDHWMANLQTTGDHQNDPWWRHAMRLQSRAPLPADHKATIIEFGRC